MSNVKSYSTLLSILIVWCLGGCSVEFKSKQLDYLRRTIAGEDTRAPESMDSHWYLFDGRELYDAFAVIDGENVKFFVVGGAEIDFKKTYISQIRLPGFGGTYTVEPTSTGAEISSSELDSPIQVTCDYLSEVTNTVFAQQCGAADGAWRYTNELEVDPDTRDIVFIKTYYWPTLPPVELYLGDLYEQLKSRDL